MKLIAVESSAVRGVAYDRAGKKLTVRFHDGRTYQYRNVEEKLYRRFMRSQPHPWSTCGEEIKKHKYSEIQHPQAPSK